eukprot:315235-Pelagomonas_calceolata.AAC.2
MNITTRRHEHGHQGGVNKPAEACTKISVRFCHGLPASVVCSSSGMVGPYHERGNVSIENAIKVHIRQSTKRLRLSNQLITETPGLPASTQRSDDTNTPYPLRFSMNQETKCNNAPAARCL